MKKGKLIVYVILLATSICYSCSDEECGDRVASSDVPIRLSASIGGSESSSSVFTRAFDHQDSLIAVNETVYVWADDINHTPVIPYYDVQAWIQISDGLGHLSALHSSRFYPGGNQPVALHALHGNFSFSEGIPLPDTVRHSVIPDQTQDAAYLRSDLLYAYSPKSSPVTAAHLLFSHLLSKVKVSFIPYGEITASNLVGAKASLCGIRPTVAFCAAALTAQTEGVATDILLDSVAIIPPQTCRGILMTLELTDGRKFYYVPEQPITFEAGKVYVFNMNVKHLIKFGQYTGVEPWTGPTDYDQWLLEPANYTPEIGPWGGNTTHRITWSWLETEPEVDEWEPDSTYRVTLPEAS